MNVDFDICIYCGADGCEYGTAVHADDCPSETGVFPITVEDSKCFACGAATGSMHCMDCNAELKLGDHYTHRWIEDDVGEIVCLGCAALEASST